MVPYADFNLLKFPDREQAIEKIADLTLLSDIFPTGEEPLQIDCTLIVHFALPGYCLYIHSHWTLPVY